jgi:hypothetical protein
VFEVGLCLPDILGAKVAQLDTGDADTAGITLGQKRLARAHRPTKEIAHGGSSQTALRDQLGILAKSLLRRVVSDDQVQGGPGRHEFDQILTLPLDELLLQRAKAAGIDGLALGEQNVEVDQAEAGGQLGQLVGVQIGGRGWCTGSCRPAAEVAPLLGTGQGDLDGPHVRTLHEPLVDLGQPVRHQAKGHVGPLDVRVLGPAQETHQGGSLTTREGLDAAPRDQVLSELQDDGEPAAPGQILLQQVPLDQPVQPQKDSLGVARPVGYGAELLNHGGQALGIAPGQGTQAASPVIVQDQVPRSEELSCQELGQVVVTDRVALGAGEQVVDVAVQHEQAGGRGVIQLGQLPCPGRVPGRQGWGLARGRFLCR